MPDNDLLLDTFLKEGKKQKLDEDLLTEIFTHMHNYQHVPSGERDGIRAELQKIIKTYLGD